MKLKQSLLMLTAAASLFGAAVTTASAATIQALPSQTETQAAHDAVESSSTTSSAQTAKIDSDVVISGGETGQTS